MNNSIDNNNKTELLRRHISEIIKDRLSIFFQTTTWSHKYSVQIKSWCITLFMVSVGFCLKEKPEKLVFIALPLIPLTLFWLLHAYIEFLNEKYKQQKSVKEMKIKLIELYNYGYPQLEELLKELIDFEVTWTDKGAIKVTRFFSEKIPGICKKLVTFENILFFGVLFMLWLVYSFFRQPIKGTQMFNQYWLFDLPQYYYASISAIIGVIIGLFLARIQANRLQKKESIKLKEDLIKAFQFNLAEIQKGIDYLTNQNMVPNFRLDDVSVSTILFSGRNLFTTEAEFNEFNWQRYQLQHLNKRMDFVYLNASQSGTGLVSSEMANLVTHLQETEKDIKNLLSKYKMEN